VVRHCPSKTQGALPRPPLCVAIGRGRPGSRRFGFGYHRLGRHPEGFPWRAGRTALPGRSREERWGAAPHHSFP
jgi:hypothetical protein